MGVNKQNNTYIIKLSWRVEIARVAQLEVVRRQNSYTTHGRRKPLWKTIWTRRHLLQTPLDHQRSGLRVSPWARVPKKISKQFIFTSRFCPILMADSGIDHNIAKLASAIILGLKVL